MSGWFFREILLLAASYKSALVVVSKLEDFLFHKLFLLIDLNQASINCCQLVVKICDLKI